MCGIAGIMANNREMAVDMQPIISMCNAIAHRGPDDEGFFHEGNLGMGMRRLSIIDLSTGKQPIFNEDERLVIVFNGEIYNYLELRAKLENKGHRFRTHSDTEVILHAYEEFGAGCVDRLNGMFAFAIWDRLTKNLFLARDRIGIKPLYYFHNQQWLIFGSEIKTILEHRDVPREIDPDALSYYLQFGHVIAPKTLFKHIKKLPPGTVLHAGPSGIKLHRYWRCQKQEYTSHSLQEYAEQFLDLFQTSVNRRMIADVPLGAFLSGGLDSSSIVAMMSEVSTNPIETHTIGFTGRDKYHDETPLAKYVSQLFNTKHNEIIVSPDIAGLMTKLVWYMDEPIADSSYLVTYMVSKLASKSVKVILSGVGGDEIFGGYRRYLGVTYDRYFDLLPPSFIRWSSRRVSDLLPADRNSFLMNRFRLAKSYLRSLSLPALERYDTYVSLLSEDVRLEISTYANGSEKGDLHAVRREYFEEGKEFDSLNRILYLDICTSLVDRLLLLTDKMTMACGLEARVPFLDHELVEWALSVPAQYKLKGSKLRYIQKYAMQQYLPPKVIQKRKKGFGCPVGSWFRNELKNFSRDILSPSRLKNQGLFNHAVVERILNLHANKEEDYGDLLFGLLTFQLWHQEFVA